MAFQEDLSVFVDPDAPGVVPAIYTKKGMFPQDGTPIYAQFFNEFEAASLFNFETESAKPLAMCPVASVPDVTHGATLTISNVDYNIVGIQPDGTGMVTLILSKD